MSSSGALPEADLGWLRVCCSDPPPPPAIDHFDQLPDSVLLLIFNLVGDIKQLGRCCVVARRFHAVVPLVDDVVVRVDCVISDDPCPSPDAFLSQKPRSVISHLARLVLGGLVKPLQALGQILSPASASVSRASSPSSSTSSSPSPDVAHHSPSEVLKNFREIRRLRIELPDGELGKNGGVLLKWRAEFGSTIRSCVILGASSVASASSNSLKSTNLNLNHNPSSDDAYGGDDYESIPESFYTNGSLKRRVVWTISSLIAASARHYLLHPIVVDHEPLESLILTDADGQGVLTMDRQQLQELRFKPLVASGSSQRTLLPALSMRLWYAHELELSCGLVLKGATLLAIKPSDERSRDVDSSITVSNDFSDSCWISECFEEPYRTATMMLMKRRIYCLEMNSF